MAGFRAGPAWWAAAAVLVAVAANAADENAVTERGREPGGADAAGGGDAEQRRRRDPLPAGPLLLEQALRGLLEAAPGRETLDDVMRRAAGRNRAAARAAEEVQRRQFIRQQAQHFEKMIQPLLGAELAYVRRSCGSLSREARAAVLAAGREGLSALAERLARLQLEGVEPGAGPIDIRLAMHDKVAAALEPLAAREEFAAYARESRLRQERRADTARIRIVARLDAHLGLTAAQRSAVLDDLAARWQPAWLRELDNDDTVMINNHPLAPDFAAASIEPHLDPVQQAQWALWREVAGAESAPRSGIDWSELNALQQGQQTIDDWWRP